MMCRLLLRNTKLKNCLVSTEMCHKSNTDEDVKNTREANFIGSSINNFCRTIWYSLGEEEWKWNPIFQVFIVAISKCNIILETLGKYSFKKKRSFKMKRSCRSVVLKNCILK